MSFSAVTCHGCRVKELCTKREKNKGRIFTLSPQPVHEARSHRRTEQAPLPLSSALPCGQASKAAFPKGFAAMVCAARYRGQPKTQLQATAIAATINLVRIRQMLQRTALGGMMSGQNFPAESFIHPVKGLGPAGSRGLTISMTSFTSPCLSALGFFQSRISLFRSFSHNYFIRPLFCS